jgi:hypothetical protein
MVAVEACATVQRRCVRLYPTRSLSLPWSAFGAVEEIDDASLSHQKLQSSELMEQIHAFAGQLMKSIWISGLAKNQPEKYALATED